MSAYYKNPEFAMHTGNWMPPSPGTKAMEMVIFIAVVLWLGGILCHCFK